MMMQIQQTKRFQKAVKKLHSNQKQDLDNAIRGLMQQPDMGEMKKGDLAGVRVYKFKMQNQLTLIAYRIIDEVPCLLMLSLGSHENFYRDLKVGS
jgi:mRNA-degrading endonuclease YafQ of YafQ-DinJ toxin-antitoxin module